MPPILSRYGPLFVPSSPSDLTVGGVQRERATEATPAAASGPERGYLHRFQSLLPLETPDDGDIQVVARGAIAITPLRLDVTGALPRRLQAALESARKTQH